MEERYEHVSVFYPRGVRTGGPEALHQLVDALRSLGHDAVLVPLPGTADAPRVEQYRHYDAPEAAAPRNGPRDVIVVPEVVVPSRKVVGEATLVYWWLSVDNSPVFMNQRLRESARVVRPTIRKRIRSMPRRALRSVLGPSYRRRLAGAVHVAQSTYARDFVSARLGVAVGLLTDYVTSVPSARTRPDRDERAPVVSFNPAKGGDLVARVADRLAVSVRWLPITGMSPAEVDAALEESDVYLDLGHLPGKDRMPREAALRGAVTLISTRGAGGNDRDFPLPTEHRIPAGDGIVDAATDTLQAVLDDLPGHRQRQATFRACLADERRVFLDEVAATFGPAGDSR